MIHTARFIMFKHLVFCILLSSVCMVWTKENLISDNPCNGLDRLYVSIEGGEVECGSFRDYWSVDGGNAPLIRYPGARKDRLYLVLMFDPDASCGSRLHYAVANVKGEDLIVGDLSEGYSMAVYYNPFPTSGSRRHRYFIYAFEQYIVIYQQSFARRCGFDVNTFASDNSLSVKAVNMFTTSR